jgi:hypothetical protein
MRALFLHWLVVVLLLSSGLPAEFLVESPIKHVAAEEDSSSERQDESFKPSALRKRNAREKKTKLPRATLSADPIWPSYVPLANDHRQSFEPLPLVNLNLHQLHQVFRI